MIKNEKAPVGSAIPARAWDKGVAQNYNSIPSAPLSIVDYISVGRGSAHTAREIADWLEVKPRDVTRQIERARLQGTPICATCNSERPGYYIAKDAEELTAYLRRFKSRRRNLMRTESALIATLCKLTGQQRMDFTGGGE